MSLDINSGFSKSLYVLDPEDAKDTSLRFFTSKYCLYYDMTNLSVGVIDIKLTDENLRAIERDVVDTDDDANTSEVPADTSDTGLDPVLNGDFSMYAGDYTFTYMENGIRLPELDDTATLDINGCWNGAPPITIEKNEDGSYYIIYEEWVYHEEADYSTGSGCYIFPVGISSPFENDDLSRIRALPVSGGGIGNAPYYKD